MICCPKQINDQLDWSSESGETPRGLSRWRDLQVHWRDLLVTPGRREARVDLAV